MKVTRKMLQAMVVHLNRNLNRPSKPWNNENAVLPDGTHAISRANIGHFYLGVAAPGDGWVRYSLREMVNHAGSAREHFSGNNQDMYAYLRAVDDATRLGNFPKEVQQ